MIVDPCGDCPRAVVLKKKNKKIICQKFQREWILVIVFGLEEKEKRGPNGGPCR